MSLTDTGFLAGDMFYRAQAARFGATVLAQSDRAGVGVGPDPRGSGLRLLASGEIGEIADLLLSHPLDDVTSVQAPLGTLDEVRRRAGDAAAEPWPSLTSGRAWDLLVLTEAPPRRDGEGNARALEPAEASVIVPDVLAEAYPDTWALQHVDELS
ncbi:MAG: hypothetical protein ACTHW7_01500, partial [Actinomycetaceae bacterium]